MYTEHFHIYIIDSPTRHNISHLDKRSSLVHYHRMILYSSIHVCYSSGEVIYCVLCVAFLLRFRSCPTAQTCPRDLSVIGGCAGPLRQWRSGMPVTRRLRPATGTSTSGTKADPTATHTGHDDQSESDSQSQVSEETNTAPQVLSRKRKVLVCMAIQRLPTVTE